MTHGPLGDPITSFEEPDFPPRPVRPTQGGEDTESTDNL